MKCKHFLILLLTCTILSCTNEKTFREAEFKSDVNILPPDSMKMFMRDMYLTESYIRWTSTKGDDPSFVASHFYQLLFKKYHLDTHRVNISIKYYMTKEDEWIEILSHIINEDFPDIETKPKQSRPF